MSGWLTAALVPRASAADKVGVRRVLDSPGSILSPMLSLILPPRCPGCAIPVEADHRFCASCWADLRFVGPPWCAGCNVPFDYDRGEGALCGHCLAGPPRHGGVRAAVAYGAVARRLALRLKYARRIGIAETMARLMVRGLPVEVDLLIPVPLHRWRLWSRGYNQAALIAEALGRERGIATDIHVLARTKRTPVLRGMDGRARSRAVAGAFRVNTPATVKGRNVVLVDDVYTSGATADACVRALLRAGAASVVVACWARVLNDGDD